MSTILLQETSNQLLQALKASLQQVVGDYKSKETGLPIFDVHDPALFAVLGLDNWVAQPESNLYIRIHMDSLEGKTYQNAPQVNWNTRKNVYTQNYQLGVKMHVHSTSDNPAGFGLEENLLWKFNNSGGLWGLDPFTPLNSPAGRFRSKSIADTQGDATFSIFHMFSFILLVAKTVESDIITYDKIDIQYQQYN